MPLTLPLCRQCNKRYDPQKSRALFRGYCSQACLKKKAHLLGYRPKKDHGGASSMHAILKANNEVGERGAPPPLPPMRSASPNSLEIPGILEIDLLRGVIYFHSQDPAALRLFSSVTPLRICSLPAPIDFGGQQLDITHFKGVSWASPPTYVIEVENSQVEPHTYELEIPDPSLVPAFTHSHLFLNKWDVEGAEFTVYLKDDPAKTPVYQRNRRPTTESD